MESIIVALVTVTGVMLAYMNSSMQTHEAAAEAVRIFQLASAADQVTDVTANLLSDPAACALNLNGIVATSKTQVPAISPLDASGVLGPPFVAPGTQLNNVTVSMIEVRDLVVSGGTSNVNLAITYKLGPRFATRSFPVSVTTDAGGLITACQEMSFAPPSTINCFGQRCPIGQVLSEVLPTGTLVCLTP